MTSDLALANGNWQLATATQLDDIGSFQPFLTSSFPDGFAIAFPAYLRSKVCWLAKGVPQPQFLCSEPAATGFTDRGSNPFQDVFMYNVVQSFSDTKGLPLQRMVSSPRFAFG